MARTKKSAQDKRLNALAEKTESQKKAIVAQLRRTPIVQLACERTDVGRSTYYKWRARDKIFARVASKAQESGKFFINDLAESKLLRLVQDDNLSAIIFWLKHNHPKYAVTTRHIHEYEIVSDPASVEEVSVWAHEMAKIQAYKMRPLETTEELKERLEDEWEHEEQEEPERKRQEALEDDSEDTPKAS